VACEGDVVGGIDVVGCDGWVVGDLFGDELDWFCRGRICSEE
jgi:hypothetical protein